MSQELIYLLMGFIVFTFFVCWIVLRQHEQLREIRRSMLEVRNSVPLHRKINFFRNFGLWTFVDAKNKGGKVQFNLTHFPSHEDMDDMVICMINTQEKLSLHEAIEQDLIEDMEYVEKVFNKAIDYYLKHWVWKFSND